MVYLFKTMLKTSGEVAHAFVMMEMMVVVVGEIEGIDSNGISMSQGPIHFPYPLLQFFTNKMLVQIQGDHIEHQRLVPGYKKQYPFTVQLPPPLLDAIHAPLLWQHRQQGFI